MVAERTAPWGVIFDVDGTMVDNVAFHEKAWLTFGERHDLPITSSFYREKMHSRSNDLIAKVLYGEDVSPALAAAMNKEKEAIYRELYRPHIKENPGLTPLLEALHREKIPCAAASNSPPENVDMILEGLHVRHFFKATSALDGTGRGKPHPDLLLKAAQALELKINRCVVLEDSISGFEAAERAGAPFIVISCGSNPASLLHTQNARAIHLDFTTLTPEVLRAALSK
ncbi:MAG TPA: HAD family phosphatase [Candidatus Hydrogenedentes bacterium]|nr:HAD family phosphatase [Candidatus Hydrogenedentota bacterium]